MSQWSRASFKDDSIWMQRIFQYYAVAANRNEQEIQTDRVHHPQTKQNKR